MGLFNKSKDDSNAFIRKGEEAYYHQALTELESGKVNKGVYARALADSSGDDAKTQSLYLKYRVQSIADDGAIEILKSEEKKRVIDEEKNAISETRWVFEWVLFFAVIGFFVWLLFSQN